MPESPIPLGVYQHFKAKGGEGLYLVRGIARDEAEENPTPQGTRVFYKALYGEFLDWHRSLAEFTAQVPDPENPGETVPRFKFICPNPLSMGEHGLRAIAEVSGMIARLQNDGGRLPASSLPATPTD